MTEHTRTVASNPHKAGTEVIHGLRVREVQSVTFLTLLCTDIPLGPLSVQKTVRPSSWEARKRESLMFAIRFPVRLGIIDAMFPLRDNVSLIPHS